jgi:hypothetical protein
MSGIIHFTSGKKLEITQKEMDTIAPKLQAGGIRMYRTGKQCLIPLNSNTMELIEFVPEVEAATPKRKIVTIVPKKPLPAEPEPDPQPEEEEEKTLGAEEREKNAMNRLIEKSNCKHDAEKLELYIQHTAKGVRYFPVCSFCGKRERYVSEKKIVAGEYERWTEADIATAKPWVEV